MTIANTKASNVFNANGVTRDFALGFVYDENVSGISIKVIDTEGTETEVSSNYTIYNGVLTYPTVDSGLDPLAEGYKITIERLTPHTQNIDLIQQGPLDAETLEGGYDKLTLEIQELQENMDRAIKFPVQTEGETDAEAYLQELENLADRAEEIEEGVAEVVEVHNSSEDAHSALLATKQNVISDLEDIRSGASAGATALQLSDVVNTYDAIGTEPVNGQAVAQAVSAEASLRSSADINLQTQIDAITSAKDVADVVADYTELQNYDTSSLTDQALIKVLIDSTHNNAETYYRWHTNTSSFSYVGSAGASYTKAESDAKFLSQTDAASTYVNNTTLATELAKKSSNADGSTITDDGTTISTVAVKEQNTSTVIKKWVGTKAEYDAIANKDSNTTYYVTDEDTDSSFYSSSFPLFYHFFSDHVIGEASWLRADTFSWQSGSVYTSAYQHLVDDITGKTAETETISGITITFYRATDGHKIVLASEETNIADLYDATGVAWYYILDTSNTRFKLPRTKYNVVGLRDTVGNYVEESLPNITGTFKLEKQEFNSTTGAFELTGSTNTIYAANGASRKGNFGVVTLDAHNSSSTYQDNAPVQQRATQMYLYFYCGNTVQDQTTIDVGEITEALNEKVDLPTGRTQTNIGLLVETYSNGTSWYRVYSDGWCEQGGKITSNDTSDTQVIFLKEFADTNYSVVGLQEGTIGNAEYCNGWRLSNLVTTSCYVHNATNGTNSFHWRACGYIN